MSQGIVEVQKLSFILEAKLCNKIRAKRCQAFMKSLNAFMKSLNLLLYEFIRKYELYS